MSAKKGTPFFGTWVLVLVAGGLLYYVFFVEMKKPAGEEAKPKEKALAFDRTRAREVRMAAFGAEPLRLTKDGTAWTITAPSTLPADPREVDGLLTSLEGLEVDDVIVENPTNLAQYGLQPPRTTVAVQLAGAGPSLELDLGGKTPGGGGVYAKVAARPRVFTIPAYLESSFQKTAHDLRDRDILHIARDAVTALQATGPEGAWAVARDAHGDWAFSQPLLTRAGRWSVDGVLGAVESLRFDSVASESPTPKDLKTWGLAPPARTMTVTAGAVSKTLQLGGSAGDKKYYARDAAGGPVFVIPSALADDLAKGMDTLRAKRLLDIATYEVEGFDVEGAGAKKVFARQPGKDAAEGAGAGAGADSYTWKRDNAPIETNKVQDALFLVGGEEVAAFVDAPGAPEAYGLDKPLVKTTLRFEKGKPGAWFTIGLKDGRYYARRNDDAAVLQLDPKKAPDLVKAFKEL